MSHLSIPLTHIVDKLNQEHTAIEDWFKKKWQNITPPFYTSVDLRYSKFKLAPIDVNLFPAGFNNLTSEDKDFAVQEAKKTIEQKSKDYKKILVITENHTRNSYYLEHLATLKNILNQAGFTVKLSMLNTLSKTFYTLSNQPLLLETVTKNADYLHVGDFIPDCILLNNDLSESYPELLAKIRQPILPSPTLGWYQRKKSHYFHQYNIVCEEFAQNLGWDNFFINPLFTSCDDIDFTKTSDQRELFEKAQEFLKQIDKKYQNHSVAQKPYLIIKANSGSYGMGVLSLEDATLINHLSRKERQHMIKTKGNRPIQSVILQEGIPSMVQLGHSVAEPVVYLIGTKAVGGFYRAHTNRTTQENLNTPGMQLIPFSLHEKKDSMPHKLLYAYQVIARLATLAAAFEIEALEKDTNRTI